MFRNTLFTKLFFLMIVVSAILIPGTYFLSIPMVDDHIYQIEEHSGKTTLDNIFTLLKQSKHDLADWESFSLEKHKKNLKDIVSIASTCLNRIRNKYNRGLLSLAEAQAEAIAEVSCFRYANNDYLYISDYDGNFIYHPDPQLHGTNSSDLKDIHGKLIVTPMIEKARLNGASYHDYWWHRLGEDEPSHKLTYTKDLPDWQWVIGSGVYLDDIQDELAERNEKIISFLRDYLRSTKIAANGYMYIFDGDLNMIIHPNANIEGTNFATLKNPISGKSVGKELMAVATASDNKLVYKWDKPSDPGHYVYDKVAWVRYLPEYDYYLASSVYMDDLLSSGKQLATRLFQVTIFTIIFLTICGLMLIYNITSALKKLALTANRIISGDLTDKADIRRKDEIGQLGQSFNQMIDKLKDQINNL
ncbi:MAG: cache domain-containing protein, partial [Thermodesulfobacteriota bacterium]|nr:cache domain-containing protein [Thermodesulfobacteriota bacterium]